MIVRSPRTKLAGFRGIDGFGVGVGEGVVGGCMAGGVTEFGGGATVVVGAGEIGTVVGVGEGVVGGCTAGGVTGFGGDTTGVDGAGESGTVDGAGAAVGLFVAIGVWQPKPFTSKTTAIASANNDFLGLILVSKSPRSQP